MKKKESLELELQILNEKPNLTKRQLRKKEKLISKIQKQMNTDELLQQKNKTEMDNKQVSEDILDSNNKGLQSINDDSKVESVDVANDSSKLNVNQLDKNSDIKIKNHILYLSSDDLIDLYLHSTVGTDERVYLSHALLDKYQISNPDVEFVNVNGVNIPVEKFGDIAFKDPKYVLENHDVPKDDEEKFNELKNLTAENDESLANDVDLLAKEQPITPILDDDNFLQEKYNMFKNVEINDSSSVPTTYLTNNQYTNDLGYKYYYRDGFNIVKTSPDDFISNVTCDNTKNNLNKIFPVEYFLLMKAELVSPNFINNSKSIIKENKIDNSINNQYKDLPASYLQISDDNGKLPSNYYLNEKPSVISKISNKAVDNSLNEMLPVSYFVNKDAIMVSPNSATNNESKSFKVLAKNDAYSIYSDLPKAYWVNEGFVSNKSVENSNPKSEIINNDVSSNKTAIMVSPNITSKNKSHIEKKSEDNFDHKDNFIIQDLPEQYLTIDYSDGKLPKSYYFNEDKSIINKSFVTKIDNSLNEMLPVSYFVNKDAIMVSPNSTTNNESKSFKVLAKNDAYSIYSDLPKAYWNKDYTKDIKNNNDLNNIVSKSSFVDSKKDINSHNDILSESDFINKSPIMISPNAVSKDKNCSNLTSENSLNNYTRNFINQDLPKQYLNIDFSDGKLPDDYYWKNKNLTSITKKSNLSDILKSNSNKLNQQRSFISIVKDNAPYNKKFNKINNFVLNDFQANYLEKYLVDPKRKIYIIEDKDAVRLFKIDPKILSNKKIIANGNVFNVFFDSEDYLFNAPYENLDNDSMNDNIFFLPHGYRVSLFEKMDSLPLLVNNFEVEINNIGVVVSKQLKQKLININQFDMNKFETSNENHYTIDFPNNLNYSLKNNKDLYFSLNSAKEIHFDYRNFSSTTTSLFIDGVHQQINIVNVFNLIYNDVTNSSTPLNRLKIHLYKMMKQILFDSSYYVENKLLLLNYSELLVFLTDYLNLNQNIIYNAEEDSNSFLKKVLDDRLNLNMDSIPGLISINNDFYQIPHNYVYVFYKNKLFNIIDDNTIDFEEIDNVLLNRPQFSEDELSNTNIKNYSNLENISPYIDLVNFYKTFINVNGQESDLQNNIVEKEIKSNDTIYLTISEFKHLYNSATILDSSSMMISKNIASQYGLDNPSIKYINVNGRTIELNPGNKKPNNDTIYLSRSEFTKLYNSAIEHNSDSIVINKNIASNYSLDNNINFVNVEGQIIQVFREPTIDTSTNLDTIPLTLVQFNSLVNNSRLDDGSLFVNKNEANKYGIDNSNIKYINVENKILLPVFDLNSNKTDSFQSQSNVSNESDKQLDTINLSLQQFNELFSYGENKDDSLIINKDKVKKYGLDNPNIKYVNVEGKIFPIIFDDNKSDNKLSNNLETEKDNTDASNKIKDTINLSEEDLSKLYKHSRISEDGTAYIDSDEAKKLGLDDKNIKFANINNEIIPIEEISKQKMNENLSKEVDYIPIKDKKTKKNKHIKKEKENNSNELINNNPIVTLNNDKDNVNNNDLDKSISDGILHLTPEQMNDLYVESRIGNDSKAYISSRIAQKYDLLNPKYKAIEVNNTIIPIEKLNKQDFKHNSKKSK